MINFLMYLLLVVVISFAAVVAVRVFVGEWKDRNYICAILEAGVIIFSTAFLALFIFMLLILKMLSN